MLFVIAAGLGGVFSSGERELARTRLLQLATAILARLETPSSAARAGALDAYVRHLDLAGPEERASAEWIVQRAAAALGRDRLAAAASLPPYHDPMADDALVAAVRAALSSADLARPADGFRAAASPEAPLLGTAYLTPEMLLVGLAALLRAGDRGRARTMPARSKPRGAGEGDELLILPLAADWDHVGDASGALAAWEAETGLVLPAGYRAFIEAHNGGRVYPNMFAYSVPLSGLSTTAAMTFLDRLHGWDAVAAAWRGETFGDRLPPDMLAIGRDPGAMEILMSLRPEDRGTIYCWPHAEARWGERTNRELFPLAGGFEAFLAGLRDVPERAGFRYWNRPALRRLARRLVV